jgi:hypothetical protein
MQKTLFSLLCLLTLTASTCKKEGDDCHLEITILNQSNHSIIAAHKYIDIYHKCILSGNVILPNESYEESSKGCLENEMSSEHPYELYLIDPSHYNQPSGFYNCDSIEYYNEVLKHYVFTIEDLKNEGFSITYP